MNAFRIAVIIGSTRPGRNGGAVGKWVYEFDYSGYIVQSTTNLSLPGRTTNSEAPVVVNGHNTVTNRISATRQFFRLTM